MKITDKSERPIKNRAANSPRIAVCVCIGVESSPINPRIDWTVVDGALD